ncbi:MAG: histidine phosphatase family protein [Chloroflexi bacterium]|nr:histidine phosphatase family protein [Chloroflexota bacterium]
MTLKRVIFVRPGETDWNHAERWQGWLDTPINAHGQQQVEKLATLMRNIGIARLYTSDLRRARQTAEVIGQACGVTPIPDPRLRERNIGRWQGMKLEEVHAWFPDQYEHYVNDRYTFRIPEGETLTDVGDRMEEAFHEIVAAGDVETIAIVTHTVSIRVLLYRLIPGFDAESARLGNSSVTTIEPSATGWRIVVANDISHLEGLESRIAVELEDHGS